MIGINVLHGSYELVSTHVEAGGCVRIRELPNAELGGAGSSDTYTCTALRDFYEKHGPAPVKIVDGRLQTRRADAPRWTRYLYVAGDALVSSTQLMLAGAGTKQHRALMAM